MPGPAQAGAARHAEMYPFDLPAGSDLFRDGRIGPITAVGSGRTPVLAPGLNGTPGPFARKFPQRGATIPVTRAMPRDPAVVLAAHFASVGALPATLARHPGSIARLFGTWLDEAQPRQMHASAGVGTNDDLVRLPDAAVEDAFMGRSGEVAASTSRARALLPGRQPIRVAAIPTIGRALPALAERAALQWRNGASRRSRTISASCAGSRRMRASGGRPTWRFASSPARRRRGRHRPAPAPGSRR